MKFLNFPQHKFQYETSTFLQGLISYFGGCLRNFVITYAVSQLLLRNATSKTTLDWLPEYPEQFNKNQKDSILPKIHYINPNGEVVVCTDA